MSDQDWADKVAEIECYSIEHTGTLLDGRKKYKIECGVKTSEPMSIDRVNTIIRSSTPDIARLVGAVKAYRVEKERGWPLDRPIDDAYFEACDNLEKLWQNVCSALSSQEPKVCEWVHDVGHDKWDTNCGNAHCFIVGSPSFNNHNFCPYCGGVIKVKE